MRRSVIAVASVDSSPRPNCPDAGRQRFSDRLTLGKIFRRPAGIQAMRTGQTLLHGVVQAPRYVEGVIGQVVWPLVPLRRNPVASAGLVGFVGLVVPHIARRFGVAGHRTLLVSSALIGATLVIVADVVARVALPPAELPLGAVTAVLGVPFFLVMLRRMS